MSPVLPPEWAARAHMDVDAYEAAQAAAQEQVAEGMAKQFDDAVAAQNWQLAKAHGDILQIEHPGSAAATSPSAALNPFSVSATSLMASAGGT